MEYINSKSIKLRDIFLDNGNWWKFFFLHHSLIRPSININVLKMIVCRTSFLGFHLLFCPICYNYKKIPHSCKSRFCCSCGKKNTDNWINSRQKTLPNTKWQHITFTMDARFWDIFWLNRHLINKIPPISANIVKKLAAQQDFLPGIFLAIHTFGRDLKRNIHIHLSTTAGGLRISDNNNSWNQHSFFYHLHLKNMWRYQIISLLLTEFNNGNLILPKSLHYIKSFPQFYYWCQISYNKTWNVFIQKQSADLKQNVSYLGRYLKRPPISETRINSYDGKSVSFSFLDHYTGLNSSMSLPVFSFIARLISHIPDVNFRNIRYYGFLSNRLSSQKLPIVYRLLNMSRNQYKKMYISWKDLIIKSFSFDPTVCSRCKSVMLLSSCFFPRGNILMYQKEIAHGSFQPVS